MPTFNEAFEAGKTIDKLKAQKSPLSPEQQQELDGAEKVFARKTEYNILNQKAGIEKRGGKLHPTTAKALADAQAVLARPDRGSQPPGSQDVAPASDAQAKLALQSPEGPAYPSRFSSEGLPPGGSGGRPKGTPNFQLSEGEPASGTADPSESGTATGPQSLQHASPLEASDSEPDLKKRQDVNRYIRDHMEPREHPISEHVTIDKKDHHGLIMQKAALLADIVHDNDFMTPLVMGREVSRPDAHGEQISARNGNHARANVSPNAPRPILTSLHEIGHHVEDHRTLEQVRPVIEAAKASSNVDLIKQMLSPEDIEYYTRPSELWARAYAQYVALRSGDPEAQAELQSVLDDPRYSWIQWDKSEWPPIEDAITEALKRRISK